MDDSLDRGVFILSLDTELAWGSAHGSKFAQREVLFQQSRYCISRLLELLEKYEIRSTWAVVGHLFLEGCQPVNGIKHPEIIRPVHSGLKNDWFAIDPCSRLEDDPIWYGRDIVNQILSCKIPQEIGCHTFSHIQVGDPDCSRECFKSELRACRLAAEELGVTLKSFVFPRNIEGKLEVLSEQGFLTYRGELHSKLSRLSPIIRIIINNLRVWPTALPEERAGLWNLPGCLFYPPPKGVTWPAAVALQVWKAKMALRLAARKRRLFHLYFHPFNLANNPDRLFQGLEKIFIDFCHYRKTGLLDNLTMGELTQALKLKKEITGFSRSNLST